MCFQCSISRIVPRRDSMIFGHRASHEPAILREKCCCLHDNRQRHSSSLNHSIAIHRPISYRSTCLPMCCGPNKAMSPMCNLDPTFALLSAMHFSMRHSLSGKVISFGVILKLFFCVNKLLKCFWCVTVCIFFLAATSLIYISVQILIFSINIYFCCVCN